jgi:hypothetical protein
LGYTELLTSNAESLSFTIVAPGGSTIYNGTINNGSTNSSLAALPELTTTGTYKLQISRDKLVSTTSLKVWLSTDITGTLVAGGPAVMFTTARPGQNARYTFSATAGQNIVVSSTGNNFAPSGSEGAGTVYAPNGSKLGWFNFGSALTLNILPATGTYTLVMDPSGQSTGSISVSLQATGQLAPP